MKGKKLKLIYIVVNQISNTLWEFLYEYMRLFPENLSEKRDKSARDNLEGNLSIR